jgi:hypothetical protein
VDLRAGAAGARLPHLPEVVLPRHQSQVRRVVYPWTIV